ncbi:protein angel homolog 2 isoform X1 [Polypterus senegalus]|uniref:protein angel homolog 2 isoform X1 n=2 Tax=Polypterus senegalus TaxID=55291 RepID=UPI0019661E1C|nr:protein angel homolog 2 isoform X1 [Polypterus senegalus]XP_039594031.1 protein angel homolog 2 isoform X1 [Polypterus senegalus]XP_039594032.1 protein angel homolog 2 isoform X1 [Polypterus senegalus]XP_039594033.1 protein angel homolog 2 isoform X1 [Polypterus senegalus]
MIPRNLTTLGRSWFAQRETSFITSVCQHYPSCYKALNPLYVRPFTLFHKPHINCVLRLSLFDNFCQTAFHTSSTLMETVDDEPDVKRRKLQDRSGVTTRYERRRSAPCKTRDVPATITTSNESFRSEGSQDEPEQTRQKRIHRFWEDFSSHYYNEADEHPGSCIEEDLRKETCDFTVMSYNILSQYLLEDNAHLYKHCPRPILKWDHRFPNILQDFKDLDADILCLQEVQEDHYNAQIKPSLESLGYQCEYKMRTGRKPDGCAIGFKRSRFSLVSSHPVEFFRHGIPLLDRDNVGLVVLLKPTVHRSSSCNICVANTHLLYNPRRGDIKLTQLAMLLAEISAVSLEENGHRSPIILCGDFNSVPGSPLYSFIKDGRLNYQGLSIGKVSGQEQTPRGQKMLSVPIWPESLGISHRCQYEAKYQKDEGSETGDKSDESSIEPEVKRKESCIEHQFSLTSAYSHYLSDDGSPEITTCHSRTALTVDYIFYSAAKEDLSVLPGKNSSYDGMLKLLARLSLLRERDLWSVNGLPNEHNSSDHLPLLAKFRLEY